ncbi:MAG: rod shape-determining protein MreC [Rickettsiales bacterium]|nr:rod shape-determining protein MreC [Rickettsiales bacterium]
MYGYKGKYLDRVNLKVPAMYYIKIIVGKMMFMLLLILSFSGLIVFKNNSLLDVKIKNRIKLVTSPYFAVFTCYDVLSNAAKDFFIHKIHLNSLNNLLIAENQKLQMKILRLKSLERENRELRESLNFVLRNDLHDYVIKKINIISNNSFTNRVEINVYDGENIRENDIVVDNNGNLVGKVINKTENKAEILLTSDMHFRIAGYLERGNLKVLLSGNESSKMNIMYFLGEKEDMIEDEDIYTNYNNSLKNDVYIGKIVKGKDGFAVKTAANLSKIDYVIILNERDGETS